MAMRHCDCLRSQRRECGRGGVGRGGEGAWGSGRRWWRQTRTARARTAVPSPGRGMPEAETSSTSTAHCSGEGGRESGASASGGAGVGNARHTGCVSCMHELLMLCLVWRGVCVRACVSVGARARVCVGVCVCLPMSVCACVGVDVSHSLTRREREKFAPLRHCFHCFVLAPSERSQWRTTPLSSYCSSAWASTRGAAPASASPWPPTSP